jgi:hypothetical protein
MEFPADANIIVGQPHFIKPGREFAPQGVLKFTLKEKQSESILAQLKSLTERLAREAVTALC